jgi:hypothetical protein
MSTSGGTDEEPFSICGKLERGHEKRPCWVTDLCERSIIYRNGLKGFLVKIGGVVKEDFGIVVETDGEDDARGIVCHHTRIWEIEETLNERY